MINQANKLIKEAAYGKSVITCVTNTDDDTVSSTILIVVTNINNNINNKINN